MMKRNLLWSLIGLFIFYGCRDNEKLQYTTSDKSLVFGKADFPKLGTKPPLFRMSYEKQVVSQRDYLDSEKETANLIASSEPKTSKEKHYYEVYDDYSIGYAIERVIDDKDAWASIKRETEVTFYKEVDGVLTNYNSEGKAISSRATNVSYFDHANLFQDKEELAKYLFKKTTRPFEVKEKTKALYSSISSLLDIQDQYYRAKVTDQVSKGRVNSDLADSYEVIVDEEYGVPTYEIGYSSDGKALDKNSFYYEFDSDSSLLLVAEQYKVYRSSDTDYISVTNTFYDNYYVESF